MAKDEIQKLRDKSREDLLKEIIKERQKLQEMMFNLARGKVKNSAAVRDSKRRIARLATLANEKMNQEINAQNG